MQHLKQFSRPADPYSQIILILNSIGGQHIGKFSRGINGDYDIYISKFNEAGSDLLASTFVGGSGEDGRNISFVLSHNYGDAARGEVFVAENDQIFIASCTNSDNLPTTNSSNPQGALDACAFLFTPELDSMIFGTYLGGSQDDAAYSIKEELEKMPIILQ